MKSDCQNPRSCEGEGNTSLSLTLSTAASHPTLSSAQMPWVQHLPNLSPQKTNFLSPADIVDRQLTGCAAWAHGSGNLKLLLVKSSSSFHPYIPNPGNWCLHSLSKFRFLCCYCSITKSCLILCHTSKCSIPGFPVLHYLLEFAQIHVL